MAEQATNIVPPSSVGEDGEGVKKKNPKSANRQGKASKTNAQDKFRRRKGAQEMDALRKNIESKFAIFSKDSDEQLKSAVNAVQLTPQKRAVPLEVTTRGVGFATAICYERACTTWSLEAIADIITVHQVYRVHMLLLYLKVYLAQQIQSEPVTIDGALQRLIVPDEIREQLLTVTRVPSIIAGILDCVGKFTLNEKPFHMGFTSMTPTSGADTACALHPGNIRQILQQLSQQGNAEFVAHNPIPGALYTAQPDDMNRLANLDQVWPDGNDWIVHHE